MIRKSYVVLFAFFLILIPFAHSLALHGDHLSPIIFEPGKKIVNHYVIDGTNQQVAVSLGGELLQYIRVTEVVDNQFDLIIEVPETLPEPGSYSFFLYAKEIGSEDNSGVGSLVSVNLRFLIEVPPHGKAIGISFEVPDVNEHEPVPFTVNIASKGLEDIASLKSSITVYDLENKSAAFLSLKGKPLPALGSASLRADLPADKLSPGKYRAEAVINYDDKEVRAADQFKIGNLDLLLVNYSSGLEQEFGEFWTVVENNWGNPIQTAYASVFINGTDLLTTPAISLGPWQRGELKGILRTDFLPGNYSGTIQLFYDDLSKNETVIFTILEPAKEPEEISAALITAAAGILLFIIIGLVIGFLLLKSSKKQKK